MLSIILYACNNSSSKTADDYCEDGIQKMYNTDYQLALADFNKAIDIDPNFAKAYYHRGCLNFNMKKNTESMRDYTTAIKLDSNYTDAYYNRGLMYFYQGQRYYACKDWLKAFSLGKANMSDRLKWCK